MATVQDTRSRAPAQDTRSRAPVQDTRSRAPAQDARSRPSRVAGAAWTVDALRSVWERQRDSVDERIDLIERAIAALDEGRLDAGLQCEARRAAHMLAGSMGMFGFIGASRAARELELALAHPAADRAPALAALVRSVREGVQGEVTLRARPPAGGATPASRR